MNHVQERPCNTLVGVGKADHRGPQDISDDPKSSNRSRLPEGKRTPALSVRSSLSLKLCRFALWKSSSSSCRPVPDIFTKPRVEPAEEFRASQQSAQVQLPQHSRGQREGLSTGPASLEQERDSAATQETLPMSSARHSLPQGRARGLSYPLLGPNAPSPGSC